MQSTYLEKKLAFRERAFYRNINLSGYLHVTVKKILFWFIGMTYFLRSQDTSGSLIVSKIDKQT